MFDILLLDGKIMLNRPLDKRLGYIKDNIAGPYQTLFAKYPEELKYQAFKVEMKDMQFSYAMEMMFRQVLPTLKHGCDGLVFTCRTTDYHHGTDEHILKWKPASENSIDFRLRLTFPTVDPDDADRAEGVTRPYVDYDAVPHAELLVYHGSGDAAYRPFAKLCLSQDEWETLKGLGDPLDDRIVECAMDEQHRWRLHRFRDDKAEANHISTVNSVIESIKDSVSEQELLNAAKSIKDNWKMRQEVQKQAQSRR